MKGYIYAAGLMLLALSASSFRQDFDLKASVQRGETLYGAQCASCHMQAGEGVDGAFPPLTKNNNLKDKDRLAKILLWGMRGPLKVNNVDYNGEMPGFSLSDQDAADVMNYIRNSWGNKAAALQPKDIQPALKAPTRSYQKY